MFQSYLLSLGEALIFSRKFIYDAFYDLVLLEKLFAPHHHQTKVQFEIIPVKQEKKMNFLIKMQKKSEQNISKLVAKFGGSANLWREIYWICIISMPRCAVIFGKLSSFFFKSSICTTCKMVSQLTARNASYLYERKALHTS